MSVEDSQLLSSESGDSYMLENSHLPGTKPDNEVYENFSVLKYLANEFSNGVEGEALIGIEAAVPDRDEYESLVGSLQIYYGNATHGGVSLFKNIKGMELAGLDEVKMKKVLFAVLARAAAWGYVAGRIDQIDDSQNATHAREVKARHIGKVVDYALSADVTFSLGLKEDIVSAINNARGKSK